jgi:hypothetical protein
MLEINQKAAFYVELMKSLVDDTICSAPTPTSGLVPPKC